MSSATVNLIDENHRYVKSNYGTALLDGPRAEAICDRAQPLWVRRSEPSCS